MNREIKINWGISEDLQAGIRYEPNACKGYVMDISLGCPNRCIYCLFSPLELAVYKLKNPSYQGSVLPLKLDEFLTRDDFPPFVYMCYSSDPLGNQELTRSTITVLKKFFECNVEVLFISKGIYTDELVDIIRTRPDLMHIQVGIRNFDNRKNKIIEPGAPLYEERLHSLQKLAGIKELADLSVRIDPLLPLIDDTEENIGRIIDDASSLGIKEAIIGYVIVTRDIKEKLSRVELTGSSAEMLTQKTKTISEQELFSLPFEEKVKKLRQIEKWCGSKGVRMKTCACKDEKLKQTSMDWICHSFNRARREELMRKSGYVLEVDHLK
ncbi:MAG: radical SAM protein [Candidatus Aminicenantes bacterium]|nr:MAG: radical SAM protein [Candidatus Aminicenantes bacterium]